MKLTVIILAAGCGRRMEAGRNKVLLPLAGRPVLCHVLDMWQNLADSIVVAAAQADWRQTGAICATYNIAIQMVEGGASRAASLARALAVAEPGAGGAAELAAVHDAARPLTSHADIRRVIAAAQRHGAAILATPITDTLRYQGEGGLCGPVLPRERLLAAQTPQVFRRDWLSEAYAQASEAELAAISDDASLLQARGRECAYVWAQGINLKLTQPVDMIMAEAIIKMR
ncbi:MAG: 2-C-methyl-D-erythritol 4-phosphate cytidylyltransferase [Clostridiales bacterium]|nr:2-C-methyl-D-erythritol 4-phosphate cytidylyltransferase [Clostridiales bacterium]